MNQHIPSLYNIPRHQANIDHALECAHTSFERGQNYSIIGNALADVHYEQRTSNTHNLFSTCMRASRKAMALYLHAQAIPLFYDEASMEKWCDDTRKQALELSEVCDTANFLLTYTPIT